MTFACSAAQRSTCTILLLLCGLCCYCLGATPRPEATRAPNITTLELPLSHHLAGINHPFSLPACIRLQSGHYGIGCTLNFLWWAVTLLRNASPNTTLYLDHSPSYYQCSRNSSIGVFLHLDAEVIRTDQPPPQCVTWNWYSAVKFAQFYFHHAWKQLPTAEDPIAVPKKFTMPNGRVAVVGGLDPVHVDRGLSAAAQRARCETVRGFWHVNPAIAAQAEHIRASISLNKSSPLVVVHARGGDKKLEYRAAASKGGHYPVVPGLVRLAKQRAELLQGQLPVCIVVGDDDMLARRTARYAERLLNCSSMLLRSPGRGHSHKQRQFNKQSLGERCKKAMDVFVDLQLMASADVLVASPMSNLPQAAQALRTCIFNMTEDSIFDGRGHQTFGVWL